MHYTQSLHPLATSFPAATEDLGISGLKGTGFSEPALSPPKGPKKLQNKYSFSR